HLHDPSPGAGRRRVHLRRAPPGPAPLLPRAQRTSFPRAAGADGRSDVRLVTWNIHGGLGRDGRRDLGRIAALLEDMRSDVAALQEVGDAHRGNLEREVADQAWWVGRRMGWFGGLGSATLLVVE